MFILTPVVVVNNYSVMPFHFYIEIFQCVLLVTKWYYVKTVRQLCAHSYCHIPAAFLNKIHYSVSIF